MAGSIAFITVTETIHLIPLTIFEGIKNTTPFISGLLAYVWLGERLSMFQVIAMICCLGGITIVTVSDNRASAGQTQDKSGAASDTVLTSYRIGVMLALIIICLFAVGAVTTRRIRQVHFSVIQVYLSLTGFIVSAIWLAIEYATADGPKFAYSGAGAWIKILGASFCHFTAQLLCTCMNQSINPATVGIFMYLQIVYAYLFDIFAFGTSLSAI